MILFILIAIANLYLLYTIAHCMLCSPLPYRAMNQIDAATLHLWTQFSDLRMSPSTSPHSRHSLSSSLSHSHSSTSSPKSLSPDITVMADQSNVDALTVEEIDLERRCLGTLTDCLRSIISYAHSSYKVPISFQVKRFDRAHGQVWVKVSPDEVPEGFDLKYLLQHIKFYENIPRYAELLGVEDYKLRSTCQFFLDLQSKTASQKSEVNFGEISRVRDTICRSIKWVQEMMSIGISDRDVVQQLKEGVYRLRELTVAVDKFLAFQHNQSDVVRMTSSWFPEKQRQAARSIHHQMQHLLQDPEVVKYVLNVVGPRLGLVPFQFTPPTPGPLLS